MKPLYNQNQCYNNTFNKIIYDLGFFAPTQHEQNITAELLHIVYEQLRRLIRQTDDIVGLLLRTAPENPEAEQLRNEIP